MKTTLPLLGRVFVVQDTGRFPFHGAERWGRLVPLIERDVFPDDAEERVAKIREIMRAKLADFNPAKDFLLLTGDPVAICMAALILGERMTQFRVLKWDRENRGYYKVEVSL